MEVRLERGDIYTNDGIYVYRSHKDNVIILYEKNNSWWCLNRNMQCDYGDYAMNDHIVSIYWEPNPNKVMVGHVIITLPPSDDGMKCMMMEYLANSISVEVESMNETISELRDRLGE